MLVCERTFPRLLGQQHQPVRGAPDFESSVTRCKKKSSRETAALSTARLVSVSARRRTRQSATRLVCISRATAEVASHFIPNLLVVISSVPIRSLQQNGSPTASSCTACSRSMACRYRVYRPSNCPSLLLDSVAST